MSKNKKNTKQNKKNTKTKTNAKQNKSVGRPKYQPLFPRKAKWTFADFEMANGVDPKTGKGEKCARLTLRNYMKRPDSQVVQVKGEFMKSNSPKGLGRKPYLFQLRDKATTKTTVKVARKTVKHEPVTVNVSQTTQDYEAKKAALLAPEPVVNITSVVEAPAVVETAPTVEAPAVASEPVTA